VLGTARALGSIPRNTEGVHESRVVCLVSLMLTGSVQHCSSFRRRMGGTRAKEHDPGQSRLHTSAARRGEAQLYLPGVRDPVALWILLRQPETVAVCPSTSSIYRRHGLCLWQCSSAGPATWVHQCLLSSQTIPTDTCPFHPAPQVLDLISSDSLNVPSEEEVYRAVLSWVKHDVDSRRQHVPRVSLLGKVACFYPPSPSAWSGWTRG